MVFSSSILHIIGIRSGSVDCSIRAQTATEPMIQIIYSPNEKKSKAGSKALCDLIEENEQIRNSLLTTGFVQIVLHSLTSNTQIQSQQSSSSSNNQIPTFVKIGLLNVIQKLTDEEEGLQSLSVLIPILEELKQNGEDQLKNKARKILSLLSGEGIKYSSNSNDKEKDQKIKELEESNKINIEELHQVQQEKEREIIEKERLKSENTKLKEENIKLKEKEKQNIEKLKEKEELKQNQIHENIPIAIHNIDSTRFDFVDIDGIKKKIVKKQTGWNGISLSEVLNDGIYSIEVEFSNTQINNGVLGIVRDSYNIPDSANISQLPIIENIGVFTGSFWDNKVWHKESRTIGNSPIQEGQIIKLEYDSNKGTLICFINGVQQPVYISGINEKVRFLISTYFTESSITIHSFKKLPAPTQGHVSGEKSVQ
ncbi:MAG: hypothetical protein EZS28_036837 [Streblomastix strix]|uniref:B30.2/SPRY domain-containing protein n=1 Tax=Streblomastix strix TaxID=222440 RepID=A0A5J4U9R0_9EUKA|nr:MAG: hypothetical protein EZS28_036837 [Streblomastix strix]